MERSEASMLLTLSSDITSCRTYEDVQVIVLNKLHKYFKFNEVLFYLNNSDNLTLQCYSYAVTRKTRDHPDFDRCIGLKFFINDHFFNVIEESRKPLIFDPEELVKTYNKSFCFDLWHRLAVKEIIGFPLRMNNERIGVAIVCSYTKNTFTPDELMLAQAVSSYIGIALSNVRNHETIESLLEEINKYKFQLNSENQYLQEPTRTTSDFDGIIGAKSGLQTVFQLVSNVAASDSTVLLLGETGTGKELITNAIHHASPRRDKLMIKVNCAALPPHLIESELFGHEKGSFTGATERRIGKFELANHGTLFLDEIGELSLELQAKLLRALQEREIDRIGGKSVIKINVRIIAASNRNLKKEVDAGRFRSDLFYRLNVFPIEIPSLRDRMEDIPMLVSYFIPKFSERSGKKIKNIAPQVVREMMQYSWPGNIRELEHFIERSVLMASGDTITASHLFPPDKNGPGASVDPPFKSLEENERAHILAALKKSNGKIRGANGAAAILKIPPTTLHSKMKKLGVRKTGA